MRIFVQNTWMTYLMLFKAHTYIHTRDTDTQRERETDRQTERETHTHTESEGERDRETHRQRHTHTLSQRERERDTERYRQTRTHAHSPSFPSLHLCHSSFSNPSVASLTPQLILQPFFHFSYVTSSSLCIYL